METPLGPLPDEPLPQSRLNPISKWGTWLAKAGRFANLALLLGDGGLPTDATVGFHYIPSCDGLPTGVPTAIAGRVAMVWDATNRKLYVYGSAGWAAMN